MISDDPEQVSFSLADICQEKIENIAVKIWENKSLNAEDRQTIYLALTEEWEPLSLFYRKRGPKDKTARLRALAKDVEKIKASGQSIKDHMPYLGKKHQLQGLEKVSLDTFNKNLKSGRKALESFRLFKKNLENRKRKKIKDNM